MTTVVISLAALVALCLFVYLALRLNGGVRLTPLLATAAGIALLNLCGAWLIAIGGSGREFVAVERRLGLTLFLHVLLVSFLFLLGAFLSHRLRFRSLQVYGQEGRVFSGAQRLGMFAFGVTGAVLMAAYASQLSVIPVLAVFLDPSEGIGTALLRNAATAGFEGHYWRYNMGLAYFLPVASWYFLGRLCDRESRSTADWVVWGLLTALSLFAAVISLQKGPLLMYLIMTYVLYLQGRGRAFNVRRAVTLVCLVLLPLPLLYTVFIGFAGGSLTDALLLALHRVLGGQIYPALWYLDTFPSHVPYLYGIGLPNPGGFLPFTSVAPAFEVWARIFPELEQQGLHGTANTAYFMEWYANFGLPGMYASALVAGALVMAATRWVESIRIPFVAAPMTAIVAIQCLKLSMTDFSYVLVDPALMVTVISLLAVSVLAGAADVAIRSERHSKDVA